MWRLPESLRLGLGEPLPGHNESLDLGGALVDLVNLGIPHQLLRRVLRVVAVTTKYLQEKTQHVAVCINIQHVYQIYHSNWLFFFLYFIVSSNVHTYQFFK